MCDKVQFVSWNLDFWKKACNTKESEFYKSDDEIEFWKNYAKYNLAQLQYDFLLLQEINPVFLYDITPNENEYPFYQFEKGRKNIFYHEISKKYFPKVKYSWGNSIITNTRSELIKRHFVDNNEYNGEKYYCQNALMCYDFNVFGKEKITIINHYKKGQNWDYSYSDIFFKDIEKVFNMNKDNLIIFTGDFNASHNDEKTKKIFDTIENIGFVNCTKDIGSTMIDYEYQNDYIIINKGFENRIENIRKFELWNFSDHYGLKFTINIV